MKTIKVRTKLPDYGNKLYNTKDVGGYSECIKGKPTHKGLNVLANCVGYACSRFNEIYDDITGFVGMKYPKLNCNAENFIERAKNLNLKVVNYPTLGGIMVWLKCETLSDKDGAGHVAIVERIDGKDKIFTSESNYNGTVFYNAIRNNSNKRWGLSEKYVFRGCIINPAIGDVHYEDYPAHVNYKTLYNMCVRWGAGTNYAIKKVKDLTENGKKNATSKNPNAYAIYKKGTVYTAMEVINNENGTWAKTPSGYVCMVDSKGNIYCER